MHTIPNMLMIGGNSRNAGKTTMACRIISKLAAKEKVIAFKVTSMRPGEDDKHGTHSNEDSFHRYSITEELNPDLAKDTSKMLNAGASRVFYIRAEDDYVEEAMLDFLNSYNTNQPLICESRSLRNKFIPGLFLMMIRIPAIGTAKDVTGFLEKADKIFYFNEDFVTNNKFVDNLNFKNGKFLLQ
jgi:hypothetical protein